MPDFTSSSTDRDALDRTINAFEQAWESNEPPEVIDFVRKLDSSGMLAQELLAELCIVDMEYRWRLKRADFELDSILGPQPRLRDYERIFQSQFGLSFDSWQFAEEYRIRRLWGDAPTPDQFLAESPSLNPRLIQSLRQIDGELASDDAGVDSFSRPTVSRLDFDPRAPLAFSDFTLHELIGAGGMGKVYRATQRSLGCSVAVKALAKSLQRDPTAVDRFVEEARLLARLHHPNIVGVHGLGRFPAGGYFLVMDYVAGTNLEEHRNTKPLGPADVIAMMMTLAAAIEYSHSQGVIHCDLKPTNVLVATDGKLFISDFGFAELMHPVPSCSPTVVARRGGTLRYTAPEWIEDESAKPGPTIDIYSLGAILDKLLSACPIDCPGLDKIRDKALSRDPAQRFQMATEFASALGQVSRSIEA